MTAILLCLILAAILWPVVVMVIPTLAAEGPRPCPENCSNEQFSASGAVAGTRSTLRHLQRPVDGHA